MRPQLSNTRRSFIGQESRERFVGRSGRATSPSEDMSPSSCRRGLQFGQPDQIVGGARKYEEPVNFLEAAKFDLAHPRDGFQPAERGLDARPARVDSSRSPDGASCVRQSHCRPAAPDSGRRVVSHPTHGRRRQTHPRRTLCRHRACAGATARASTARATSSAPHRARRGHPPAWPSHRRSAPWRFSISRCPR